MYLCRPVRNSKYLQFAPVAHIEFIADTSNTKRSICTIRPIWENYEKDNKYGFTIEKDKIYGLNMKTHKKEYTYINDIPSIIKKRLPNFKRTDYTGIFNNNTIKDNYTEVLLKTYGQNFDRFIFIQDNDIINGYVKQEVIDNLENKERYSYENI